MSGAPRIYDKANSLLEVRFQDPARDSASQRIALLLADLQQRIALSYNDRIVVAACEDLLESRPTDRVRFTLRPHVVEEIRRLKDDNLERYLFYRYRYEIFPRTRQLDDFPPCLQIEPTSVCNYRCVFCYQTDASFTRPRNGYMGMMGLDMFKRIVDEAEGNCEAVTLASRGEPLLCPDIEAMLAYASGKFLGLKINTNASFLDETKSHAILQTGVNTLVLSADAATEPLYSQLRVRGKLDRVLANVERFNKIRQCDYPDSKLITRVSGVRYSASQDMNSMERVWGGLVDQVAFVDYNPWENTYDRPMSDISAPCSDLWRRMFVWFDGTINPCDVDYKSTLAVGNAGIGSLSSVWTGSKYSALREAHVNGGRQTVYPCNRCTFV